MTIFEKVKAEITPKEAVQRYGLKIAGNNMIRCPFHNDRHPSMKLNDDYFYCFGCGAYGDVIDLTCKLFDVAPIDAAKQLAADFRIDTGSPIAMPIVKVKHPKVKAFREDEMYCFRVLSDYLHLLEDWKTRYAPKTADEEYDDRFIEACQMLDYIEYLVDFLIVGELAERVLAVKELLTGGTIQDLEERMNRIRKEDRNG